MAAPFQVLINPHYVEDVGLGQAEWFGACLSVPGYAALVPRWRRIQVEALDENGTPVSATYTGWLARIVQHEVDHLDGFLLVDRMIPRTFVRREEYLSRWRQLSISDVRKAFGVDSPS